MNTVLLVVTGVSLLAAGFMAALTWRMSREEQRRSDARVAALSSAVACIVVTVAGLVPVSARGPSRQPARTVAAHPIPDAPLELLALEHERDGEQLIVRGIVRNPAGAAVPAGRLAPGATAPFVVNINGSSAVDRVRLSFRTDARIEPHVDRRTS